MRLNFEGLEIRKWNISTHSVQTDDGLYHRKAFYKVKILFYSSSKNGVIYLVNLFTSARSLKCQTWLNFCVLCWWQRENSHSLEKIFKCIWNFYWAFAENGMVNTLWSYRSWDIEGGNIYKIAQAAKNTKNQYFQRLAFCLL